ncbi:hypothetical protein JI739_18750 [Ramlibacter sp. AW1]|uniref:Uncharacterized protein n=1 Tax=Ramlibacter aurantiacus TaxID=2801330 RepID=A0A936ZRP7_9BURK|nr:hypothetical protein [Ramlibacter aurantiacus]MBL0422395.1 hypothetical protein [Ramlibacter aurantiacus]
MKGSRDHTKYVFDGQTLSKRRLVLALVKRYAQDNPPMNFSHLLEAFPDELQAKSPTQFHKIRCVVRRLHDVPQDAHKRFFCRVGEPLQLVDHVVVVSGEWNKHNIQNVLAHAAALGYAVEVTHPPINH